MELCVFLGLFLNEKKVNIENINFLNSIYYTDTFIRLTVDFFFFDIIFVSSVKVSNKILVNAIVNIPI